MILSIWSQDLWEGNRGKQGERNVSSQWQSLIPTKISNDKFVKIRKVLFFGYELTFLASSLFSVTFFEFKR